MHASALKYGKLFFDSYCLNLTDIIVVDIGAQNVNGSLRDVCPSSFKYVGVDFVGGNGVDVVLDDPYKLPFENDSLDVVVCSSVFEHSDFFWVLFLEIIRSLKPDGLFYLNVPSNGSFHQYPVDCWRFYPDSGHALVAWGKREGYPLTLLESFIGEQSEGQIECNEAWYDFVAVFVKNSMVNQEEICKNRIVDTGNYHTNGYSVHADAILNKSSMSPDHLTIIHQNQMIFERDVQIAKQVAQIAEQGAQIADLFNSLSWRLTAPLRSAYSYFQKN